MFCTMEMAVSQIIEVYNVDTFFKLPPIAQTRVQYVIYRVAKHIPYTSQCSLNLLNLADYMKKNANF